MQPLPHSLFRDTDNMDYLIQNYNQSSPCLLCNYVANRRLVSPHNLTHRLFVNNRHSQYFHSYSQRIFHVHLYY